MKEEDEGHVEWKKCVKRATELKVDNPENIPIPDMSPYVDRCLKENKCNEVWDLVRNELFIFETCAY